jgi:hypothetical protein
MQGNFKKKKMAGGPFTLLEIDLFVDKLLS